MSTIDVEQSNADKQESRVFRRDSRSHPRPFNDPHWVQRPRQNLYPQEKGYHTRSGNNYGQGSPRTLHMMPPRRQQQTQTGEDTCNPLPKKIQLLEDIHPSLLGHCNATNLSLLGPTAKLDLKESPTSKMV